MSPEQLVLGQFPTPAPSGLLVPVHQAVSVTPWERGDVGAERGVSEKGLLPFKLSERFLKSQAFLKRILQEILKLLKSGKSTIHFRMDLLLSLESLGLDVSRGRRQPSFATEAIASSL